MGGGGLARRVLRDVVRDREDAARRVSARGHREPEARRSVRHQRAADGHAHLRLRRRARRVRRRAGGAGDPGVAADGTVDDHHGVRGRRDRRHGIDHGVDRDGALARRDRGAHSRILPGGVGDSRFRHHGARAAGAPGGSLRQGKVMQKKVLYGLLLIGLAVAPWAGAYPVFVMKVLCFALFAAAFNLLIGYTGLLSFGHAMFLATAGYVAGFGIQSLGFSPELGVLAGTLAATLLGLIVGLFAIRRQGIYFAVVALALAQMVYFLFLQAPFTQRG